MTAQPTRGARAGFPAVTARPRIRAAIAAALLVGLVLPAGVAGWLSLADQRELLTAELHAYHSRVVRSLALGMRQPVWTMVPDLGRPLLGSLMEDVRIPRVLVEGDGGVFLERELPERRRGAAWTLSEPIVYEGDQIGRVTVEIDTGNMESVLAGQRNRFVATVGFQLAMSLSIIFLILHLRLVRPLRRLARQSDLLAGWQLEEAFEWKGRDELGVLGQSLERTRRSLLDLVRALEDKNAELTRLNQGLKNALAARSVFLANMSHELRTPLNSIIGFSTVLVRRLEGEISPRDLGFLRNILGSGETLLRLVNDVLDLSRIEAGKMELVLEPLNIREALEGVRRVMRRAAERKSLEVELDVASDVPVILADSGKVKQVVYHLLSNAVKFSHEGAVVGVRVRRLSAADPPLRTDAVQIDVVDHGIGIAPANHELIFEEFRQLDGGPSRMYEGTGLGLALVKKLLEIHGGQIRVSSELGRGATFSVFLPSSPSPGAEILSPREVTDSGRHLALDPTWLRR